MPRAAKTPASARAPRTPRAPRPEPEVAVEQAQAPVAAEVTPEPPFGAGEDERPDDMVVVAAPPSAPKPASAVVFRGVPGKIGLQPGVVTVIVPDDGSGYEDSITSGRTYTLPLNKPVPVEPDDVEWLVGYPAYIIQKS